MNFINFPSPNYNERPKNTLIDTVVIHYTDTMTVEHALDILTDPKAEVSSHYLIDLDGTIYQLVDDQKRAWHAGVSSWKERTNINNCSIGIELQNKGEIGFKINGYFDDFPQEQIKKLCELVRFLMKKHPIKKDLILGHSDIAPDRKKDPGEKFPWDILKKNLSDLN